MRLIDADKLIDDMTQVIDNIKYVNNKLSYDSRNYYEQDWERGFMCAYKMILDAKTVKYEFTFY